MARSDFLGKQRKQIVARLDELRPLYDEYLTLEKAQQALDQLGEPIRRAVGRPRKRTGAARGPGRPRTRRGPGRPRTRRSPARPATRKSGRARTGSGRAGTGTGRARTGTSRARSGGRRSRAGGTRGDQALQAIKASPGITIPELAQKLNIRPNYLYRVTSALQRDRKVRRRGNGFHAS